VTLDKDAAKDPPKLQTYPERTPFERLTDFARRLLTVPKSALDAEERKYQKRRMRTRSKIK
jgi:hypothetical protein